MLCGGQNTLSELLQASHTIYGGQNLLSKALKAFYMHCRVASLTLRTECDLTRFPTVGCAPTSSSKLGTFSFVLDQVAEDANTDYVHVNGM